MAKIVKLEDKKREPNPLDRLSSLFEAEMKGVNAEIRARMESPVSLIPQLAGHLISAGGKRLRPLLTLAASRLCGYEGENHIPLAACIEFLHTATLLHDDVVDDSDLRRGSETANRIWGNEASVLVGDFLFSRSFQVMSEHGTMQIMKIIADASAAMAEGEVLQLMTMGEVGTDEETYLRIVTAKTAVLFSVACRIGPKLAEKPATYDDALDSYGRNLGIAFQLIDDALDYSAVQEELGKTIGDDFREGKITLPVLLAYRRGEGDERAFWERTIRDHEQDESDLKTALELMEKHKALEDTLERARHFAARAKDALGLFPDSELRSVMCDVV
ncbi:MAG: polyprenyl synthetase family protein, partial [Alphaproteobacteria bacterium]|nr:polyprenyl synthetase family protein [Alphaproteobacteria bacterium]